MPTFSSLEALAVSDRSARTPFAPPVPSPRHSRAGISYRLPDMLAATRRWFRRNRTPIAVGVGVVGAGYLATQYVLAKINDARERMSSDRIAKEKYVVHGPVPSKRR